jgi:transcription antitermination factor NusG
LWASWFALRLRSNREFQVRAALEGASIETFLPTWTEEVRWSDRVKSIERVLFPGYIFARLSSGRDIEVALITRGVVQLLPNSFNPAPLNEKELNDVRRVVASKLHAAPCEFAAGEAVVIDSGPLAGIKGVVVRTRGQVHVVVSIELLRRSIRVELDAGTLIRYPERGADG